MEHWICPAECKDWVPVNNYFRQFQAKKDVGSKFTNIHTLYRKVFELTDARNVKISITADDYYMLYVNGKFVTQGPANAYHFVYNLNTIDITSYLHIGKNVIAVDSLYNGYINRTYNSGDNRLGLYAQVIQDENVLLQTDATWKYAFDRSYLKTKVIYGYNTQTAEYRDMRRFPHGWTEVDYADADWKFAVVKTDDEHKCVNQITPNVSTERIAAVGTTYLAPKRFVLDFGKEVVGCLAIDVWGKKGGKIITRFGEELNDDGSVRHNMRCNVDYEEEIILSGKKDFIRNYYHLSGDKAFAMELLKVAEDAVEEFAQYATDTGLLEAVKGKWNLVDWPQNLRDDYDFQLTEPIGDGCHNVINAYYYGALQTLNRLREDLGLEKKYDTTPLKDAYRKAFYRPGKKLFADSMISNHCNFHSNVLALYFGLCDEGDKARIVSFIMERGFCCGVFFAYFVLKALAENGYYEEVYRLITNDGIHSWKNMLNEGATCTFEAWGKEQKWNTSLCHPWGSSPIIILVEDLLGYRFRHGVCSKEDSHLPESVTVKITGGLILPK